MPLVLVFARMQLQYNCPRVVVVHQAAEVPTPNQPIENCCLTFRWVLTNSDKYLFHSCGEEQQSDEWQERMYEVSEQQKKNTCSHHQQQHTTPHQDWRQPRIAKKERSRRGGKRGASKKKTKPHALRD